MRVHETVMGPHTERKAYVPEMYSYGVVVYRRCIAEQPRIESTGRLLGEPRCGHAGLEKLNDGAVLKVATPSAGKTYYKVEDECFVQAYSRVLIRRNEAAS